MNELFALAFCGVYKNSLRRELMKSMYTQSPSAIVDIISLKHLALFGVNKGRQYSQLILAKRKYFKTEINCYV